MDKMTAVQWLINELKTGDFDDAPISVMLGIIEKALEMEKEKIMDAWDTAICIDDYNDICSEYYYNETYNNE